MKKILLALILVLAMVGCSIEDPKPSTRIAKGHVLYVIGVEHSTWNRKYFWAYYLNDAPSASDTVLILRDYSPGIQKHKFGDKLTIQ